jgi:hypothetical protein
MLNDVPAETHHHHRPGRADRGSRADAPASLDIITRSCDVTLWRHRCGVACRCRWGSRRRWDRQRYILTPPHSDCASHPGVGITGTTIRLGRECRRAALCVLVLGNVRDLAVPPWCGSDRHRNVYRRRNHAHGSDRCGFSVWPWHGIPKGTNHSVRGSVRHGRCVCGTAIRGNVVERSTLHQSSVGCKRNSRIASISASPVRPIGCAPIDVSSFILDAGQHSEQCWRIKPRP